MGGARESAKEQRVIGGLSQLWLVPFESVCRESLFLCVVSLAEFHCGRAVQVDSERSSGSTCSVIIEDEMKPTTKTTEPIPTTQLTRPARLHTRAHCNMMKMKPIDLFFGVVLWECNEYID